MKKRTLIINNREFTKKKSTGFALLFSVLLSSIILTIALGVGGIAFKEIKFGTSVKDSNEAFLAADTGIECALFHDKSDSNLNAFTGTATINCAGNPITLSGSSPSWSFVLNNLGNLGQACAKVSVTKMVISPFTTTYVSRGYNIGDSNCNSTVNRTERELIVNFDSLGP